jgi:hypothetical protein
LNKDVNRRWGRLEKREAESNTTWWDDSIQLSRACGLTWDRFKPAYWSGRGSSSVTPEVVENDDDRSNDESCRETTGIIRGEAVEIQRAKKEGSSTATPAKERSAS